MIFAEIIVLLGAIYLGVRLGGIAIGYAGGLGVVALTLLGLKAGNIPWDVILIIMSVIAAITAMQEAGVDYAYPSIRQITLGCLNRLLDVE